MPPKVHTPQTLLACVAARVPPAEIFAADCSRVTDEDTQAQVLQRLTAAAAHNAHYARSFLGRYVRLLEASAAATDAVYEFYCDPLILGAKEPSATAPDVLQYPVDAQGTTVAVRETPQVISGAGTTGLRTWEAALYLSNHINRHLAGAFADKTVLELGAGTGLVSLALLRNHARHRLRGLIVTDGDSALLQKMPDTFALNRLPADVPVAVQQLLWGTTTPGSADFVQPAPDADVVVAADVTYDASVVPLLCDTLGDLFGRTTAVAYVAATVRNLDTMAAWEKELGRFRWSVVVREENPHMCEMDCWFRRGTPEIRIYKIERS